MIYREPCFLAVVYSSPPLECLALHIHYSVLCGWNPLKRCKALRVRGNTKDKWTRSKQAPTRHFCGHGDILKKMVPLQELETRQRLLPYKIPQIISKRICVCVSCGWGMLSLGGSATVYERQAYGTLQ